MAPDEYRNLYQLISDNHLEIVQRLTEQETLMRGLPERVSDLEKTRWKWEGARMALAAAAGFAASILKRP